MPFLLQQNTFPYHYVRFCLRGGGIMTPISSNYNKLNTKSANSDFAYSKHKRKHLPHFFTHNRLTDTPNGQITKKSNPKSMISKQRN